MFFGVRLVFSLIWINNYSDKKIKLFYGIVEVRSKDVCDRVFNLMCD